MADVSVLSDGVNTYDIKDATARSDISTIQGNYVTTDTAQTISNTKTFTSSPIINARPILWQSTTTKGTPPASTEYTAINFVESGNTSGAAENRLGNLEFYVQADGSTRAVLRAYKNVASSSDSANIWVQEASDGTAQTYAPACSDNNSIVTQTSRSVASQNVVFGFGNDLKIATKHISLTGGTEATWNYGITFSASPTVTICQKSGSTATTGATMWVRGAPGNSSCKVYSGTSTSAMLIVVGY